MTLIEILVAVVLLGTAVVAIITAVHTTVIASRIESDHSRAQVWLQSAVEVLQTNERLGCDPLAGGSETPDVRAAYQDIIRGQVATPPGWTPSLQLFVSDVKFWGPTGFSTTCYDDAGYRLQLVEITVENPRGDIIENVSIVKSDPLVAITGAPTP
jgi:hypothetical protein